MALKRATRAFEKSLATPKDAAPSGFTQIKEGFSFPVPMKKENSSSQLAGVPEEMQDDESETHLAELLSAMYYQTTLAIDVHMGDYDP